MEPRGASYVREFYFVASNEHAAEVIGRNGWKIKAISMKTGTTIKCPTPFDPPIFSIIGLKCNVNAAKKMIKGWADNFDRMKSKKRNIVMKPGDTIDTIMVNSFDVPAIIGKRGKQVKKIAELARVSIVSPDVNKQSIFIISGREADVEMAIFWMKLICFASSGANYFNDQNLLTMNNLIYQFNLHFSSDLVRTTGKVVNLAKFNEKYQNIVKHLRPCPPRSNTSTEALLHYNCCYCQQEKLRTAKGLCGHVISCDLCIVTLFRDIYLRCYFCKHKIENFLIDG